VARQDSRVRRKGARSADENRGVLSLLRSPVTAGFPDELDAVLNYVYFNAITTTGSTTAAATYVYRLNDTYDPDLTGTGHQPMFRDQLFAIYERACVWKTDYEVCHSCVTAVPMYTVTQVTRASAVASDLSESAERGEAAMPVVVTSQKPHLSKGSADIAQRLGVTRSQLLADDLYSQDANATPTNVLYMNISAVDATASGATMYLLTKLRMHVRFRRLKEVGQS